MSLDTDKRFLVSIQWGAGPHYFVTGKAVIRREAQRIVRANTSGLKNHLPPRGALPTVRVLEIVEEVHIKRSNV